MAYKISNVPGANPIHIEDFIESISALSGEVRRNLMLIRALDRSAKEKYSEISELEKKILYETKRKIGNHEDADRNGDDLDFPEIQRIMSHLKKKREVSYQLAAEKIAIAEQTYVFIKTHADNLEKNRIKMESYLKSSVQRAPTDISSNNRIPQYDSLTVVKGDEVAIRPNISDSLWVLGRVKDINIRDGTFCIIDEDDSSKLYELDESNIIVLNGVTLKLSKGDEVLAVYPDTTSFYSARIMQPPRKSSQLCNALATVQFADDADENGVTPYRLIPVKHIIKVPTVSQAS